MSENAKKIEKILDDNNLHGEIVQDWDNVVAVEIYWGDWKHEHLRFKLLVLEQMENVKNYSQVTTEENGTDCYSAVHRFYF
jgi:hypothetical protein